MKERKLFSQKELAFYNHYEWMVNRMKDTIADAFEARFGFAPQRGNITIESFELLDGNTLKEVYFTVEPQDYERHNDISWKYANDTFYRSCFNREATCEDDLYVYREVKW